MKLMDNHYPRRYFDTWSFSPPLGMILPCTLAFFSFHSNAFNLFCNSQRCFFSLTISSVHCKSLYFLMDSACVWLRFLHPTAYCHPLAPSFLCCNSKSILQNLGTDCWSGFSFFDLDLYTGVVYLFYLTQYCNAFDSVFPQIENNMICTVIFIWYSVKH